MTEIQNRENDGEGAWSHQTALMWHLINGVMALKYYQEVQLWRGGDAKASDKPVPPELVKPPGWKPPKAVMSDPMDVISLMGGAQYAP